MVLLVFTIGSVIGLMVAAAGYWAFKVPVLVAIAVWPVAGVMATAVIYGLLALARHRRRSTRRRRTEA